MHITHTTNKQIEQWKHRHHHHHHHHHQHHQHHHYRYQHYQHQHQHHHHHRHRHCAVAFWQLSCSRHRVEKGQDIKFPPWPQNKKGNLLQYKQKDIRKKMNKKIILRQMEKVIVGPTSNTFDWLRWAGMSSLEYTSQYSYHHHLYYISRETVTLSTQGEGFGKGQVPAFTTCPDNLFSSTLYIKKSKLTKYTWKIEINTQNSKYFGKWQMLDFTTCFLWPGEIQIFIVKNTSRKHKHKENSKYNYQIQIKIQIQKERY